MAYFGNGGEGTALDCECMECWRKRPHLGNCPIALAQMEYNYEACNNEIATAILDMLVKDNGECQMKKLLDEEG